MSTSYPSDLTDAEWECAQRYLPPLSRRGRPRKHPLRRILDAIFYVLRTGCPWRYLPTTFPAWQTVYYQFRQFRRKKLWADAAYRGKELADWCREQGDGWELEVVEREPGTRGFAVLPRRWVVGRSLAWLPRNLRLAKDYERMVQTSETLIEIAATRLVLRRLGRHIAPQEA